MIRRFSIGALAFAGVLFPAISLAATVSLDPASGRYGPGDTFLENIRLSTDSSQCINAGHIEVDYPTDTLRAVDFGRGSSIFSLWIHDPQINTDAGTVTFDGGLPGGYCGRIPGDPALSNILGTIVFSVISSSSKSAIVHVAPSSVLYENDGLGTAIKPATTDATISIAPFPVSASNPWIAAVSADTIPPEPFTILIESTRDVFDGKYYVVFSTVDKQSGMDHYEVYVDGAWNHVESPYVLPDQSLKKPIQIRAIDKAGNIRLGTLPQSPPPPRQYSLFDLMLSLAVLCIMIVALGATIYLHHRRTRTDVIDLRT